jgi:hypothetical protein
MKLKHVVASMCVLGLISSPALATTKHKHHKKQEVESQEAYKGEAYKGELAAPIAMCPKTDIYTMTLDEMSQNVGRAKATVGCDKPLSLAGGIAFDSHWFNLHTGYAGENMRRLALNDAYINVFGTVNEWTEAFASLSYSGFNSDGDITTDNTLQGNYSNSYRADDLTLEQGFITFRNMSWSPLFLRVGKEFADFGRYEIHPMVRSFTQVLSESLNTTAQLGFITPMGLYGSVYSFNNGMAEGAGHDQPNYGGNIGFGQPNDQLGYDLGIGYMYDFTGVDDVAYAVGTFNGTGQYGSYAGDRVSAISLYGRVNSGPFAVGINYVTALQSFSNLALPEDNNNLTSGAKPWAANIKAGYGFNLWSKNQNISLGYEHSGDAQFIFLPESRWLAGYNVDILTNTNLGLEYTYDIAYDEAGTAGTTGTIATVDNSSTLTLRVAVKFG